jgi:hypothetical protein
VILLPVSGAGYHRFPLPVRFVKAPITYNSKTVRSGLGMSTELQKQTEVSLSNSQVKVAGWHHLSPIPACAPFLQLEKALLTRKEYELDDYCLQNTNRKPRSDYQMVELLLQGGATYR